MVPMINTHLTKLAVHVLSALFILLACDMRDDPELSSQDIKGVTESEIIIGSSLALGGHAGYLGTQF